jgi:hypothetical protein
MPQFCEEGGATAIEEWIAVAGFLMRHFRLGLLCPSETADEQ